MKTLYWHDYETWGVVPSVDRPSQFAGVRTDENLNIIGDPLIFYCQPCEDVLPHVEACLITGITPQHAESEGVSEREFIKKIHHELAQPNTCGVGYNSIRFDDEVTRYSLYRNFYDPYEREWKNGNSRWDIIDMVRLVYAVRPEGINWPKVDGKPSFKLELLTQANGISHAAAHDAYSDVEATINLARLIKQLKPALYDYVYSNRSKQAVKQSIDLESKKPLLHISSMFPSERGCAGFVAPLATHPVNKNAVIMFDLMADPEPLMDLSVDEIHQRVFSAQVDLPEGVERLPLKLVHLNKSPILCTTKLMGADAALRLGLDRSRCEQNWQKLRHYDLEAKLAKVYLKSAFESVDDPETQLYDGFIGNTDKAVMKDVRRLSNEKLAQADYQFQDTRLQEIFLRYKMRNAASSATIEQQHQWFNWVKARLQVGGPHLQSVNQFLQRIDQVQKDGHVLEYQLDDGKRQVLAKLKEYAFALVNKYDLNH